MNKWGGDACQPITPSSYTVAKPLPASMQRTTGEVDVELEAEVEPDEWKWSTIESLYAVLWCCIFIALRSTIFSQVEAFTFYPAI